MRRLKVFVVMTGAVMGIAATGVSAQVPTPPTPPTPRALDPVMAAVADVDATVDPLRGPNGDIGELPPPVCPAKDYRIGEWSCTIGRAPARCTEHRWESAPYYQSEASCIVKLGPVVVACTETTSGSQYNGSYDRSCQITRSTKPIAGCSDVRDGSYDYTKINRSCTVGPISYGCEVEYAPWDTPPKHCSVTGVPKP